VVIEFLGTAHWLIAGISGSVTDHAGGPTATAY
jgi:hypothetical protein